MIWEKLVAIPDYKTFLRNPELTENDVNSYVLNTVLEHIKHTDPQLIAFESMVMISKVVSHPKCGIQGVYDVVRQPIILRKMAELLLLSEQQPRNATTRSVFHQMLNTILDKPEVDIKVLYLFIQNSNMEDILLKAMKHPCANDNVLKMCLNSRRQSLAISAERYKIKKDGLVDWPDEWLETHYGHKLIRNGGSWE